MAYNITQLKSDLAGALHGTTVNQITNLDGMINRAGRQLLLDIDPQETIRKVLTTTPLFNQIWDYACPVDLKGNKIIDISPQYLRYPGQIISQTYNQSFDTTKNIPFNSEFTIQFNNAVKTIRINDTSLPQGVVLDSCNQVGNWVAISGLTTSITENNINFVSGSGSISMNFGVDVPGASAGMKETLNFSIDLSSQVDQASLFFYVYLPSISTDTSWDFKWGTDDTNYYRRAGTITNEGTTLAVGWNLIRIDWLGAQVFGSPDPSSINFLAVAVGYDGTAQTGILIDNIVSDMGLYRTLEYYSKYLFRDAITGAFQETVTNDSNLINLDTESYNLLFNYVAYLAAQQQQGADALVHDGPFFEKLYMQGIQRYKNMYKSQVQKPQQIYYKKPNPNFIPYRNGWF